MISITKHSDYSIVMLAHLARKPNALVSAKELAEGSKLPYPTVSKLLKLLVKSGILMSIQGSHGGYRLKKSPTEISVASVIERSRVQSRRPNAQPVIMENAKPKTLAPSNPIG